MFDLKSTVLLKRNIKISVDFKSRCSYNGGMNRKEHTSGRSAGLDARRRLEGAALGAVTGALLATGLLLLIGSDVVSHEDMSPASVQLADGSIVGTSVLPMESLCSPKTPIASITIDGETIELFITPTAD